MTTDDTFGTRLIGDIAATLPGATAVFRRFKLDFCCGGNVSLTEAAGKRGLDVAAIVEALSALDAGSSAAVPSATGALIDHIVARYHETHRRELPELARLARKVEAVHAGHPEAPQGLADTLEEIRAELEEHMQTEETTLFPLMRQQPDAESVVPTAQIRHDHDRHGELLRRLETIANGFVLPQGACRSWTALYTGTSKLVDDVMDHIHLENNVLFPRFERREAL
ncbi:iron-sulfur cluster repair di-iron protein [Bradyrhizobium sp. CCBAU 53338]|uniref:iron-sulfur cluster repair di-iron protein n=1 Tax=Bradyrhizobium sp. CCBAU 53338 TaxID=1325111 RepID=UPI00188B232D|nr:iron-sulfur cluster repair di-iron protein [Bradyrhizobium sp. CCBAU 53338]QOZ55387.1 iron-sulfur cluster repair di-iron protein [Bradyrhizobium sp. CCBAU 53338]